MYILSIRSILTPMDIYHTFTPSIIGNANLIEKYNTIMSFNNADRYFGK